jgi:transposase
MVTETKEIRQTVARLKSIIQEYKLKFPPNERDYQQYEKNYAERMRCAFQELDCLISQAISSIEIICPENRGKKSKLNIKQKVMLLLLKQLCGKSNRQMEWMTLIFSTLTGVDISYKTIERLYSDQLVQCALFNMHILLLSKKDIKSAGCCGDGTGYTLFVKEHYATDANKRKEKAKVNGKRIKCIFSFSILDLKTRMYIGYGISFKSEKEAFESALSMIKSTGIQIESFRLDKYFSCESYVQFCQEKLGKVQMYFIPKSNIAKIGLGEFGITVLKFINDPFNFLKEYYKRNQSESSFAEDKKRTGWRISQKLPERVDTANGLIQTWHNLSWMGVKV